MSCGRIASTRAAARAEGESEASHIPFEARGSLLQSGGVYGPATTNSTKATNVVAWAMVNAAGLMFEIAMVSEFD